jgi:hypothetical protein
MESSKDHVRHVLSQKSQKRGRGQSACVGKDQPIDCPFPKH